MRCATTMIQIQDRKRLTKLVSYIILSGGSLYYINKECYYTLSASLRYEEFGEWIVEILQNITKTKIMSEEVYNKIGFLRITTNPHPFFTTLRKRMYTRNRLTIDPHTLRLLDYEALSLIFMGRGQLRFNTKNNPYFYFVSGDFSYGDLFLFKKYLKDILDLEWNICGLNGSLELRCKNKSLNKLMENIAPYIFPSFQYKLLEQYRTKGPEMPSGGDIV